MSDYYIKTDSAIFELNADNFVPLGFPRNDALFCRFDLSNIFGNFDKFIYWMPTYRQHFSGNAIHSDISFPIIYSADIAKQINECARNNNVFIIIKPHPAQDLTLITAYDYSNLKFINDDFLINMDVSNYKILGNCDALITDYSSVFLDYMLVDKPMCLTWDDFEQYEKMEGFAIDIDYVMSAGEKVYNYRQLCGFIERIAKGKDLLKTQRNKILKSTHKYFDANSTNRIVNYIIENANLKKL